MCWMSRVSQLTPDIRLGRHRSCADEHLHPAIGLQTDCMMAVLAPMVRLPDSHVYALWS